MKGQQCNFCPRFSSKRTNYSHIHSFSRKEGIQSNQLTDILVDMVSTTNISFRKASAPQFRHLLNSCIEYVFNLPHKQEEMRESDLFPKINRNKLRDLTIDRSEKIKEEYLKKFAKRDVYISLDGTKLCHQSTVDVVIYGYSSDGIL